MSDSLIDKAAPPPPINPDSRNISRALQNAAHEIRHLHRLNELLSAKVEVLDVFRAVLLGVPRGSGFASGITFELDRLAAQLEGKPDPNDLAGRAAGTLGTEGVQDIHR